jgi:hypothetical protein
MPTASNRNNLYYYDAVYYCASSADFTVTISFAMDMRRTMLVGLDSSRLAQPAKRSYPGLETRSRQTTKFRAVLYKQTLWPESASELCPPSDRCLSAKLVPTFADRGCWAVSKMDPFLDRSRYCFFQVAPQLYSRG